MTITALRDQFPGLANNWHYLDTAATAQKPQVVLDAMMRAGGADYATVHRGVHARSANMTVAFEAARERVRVFLNARSTREVVFTRGTTESINLVAQSWGRSLQPGDEILISWMEHHANIVPWQMACERSGAVLRVIPIDRRGELDLAAFHRLLSPKTRLVAITQVSNSLGTIVPIAEIIAAARRNGSLVLVDGAQAVAHQRIDVQALDCDFYAFSSHKLYGPTGIGVLWARESVLAGMPPWQGGGDMIRTVSFEKTTYNELPYRFEAGTPNISGAVGLAAAIDYLESLDIDKVHAHEQSLLRYTTEALRAIPGLQIIGEAADKAGVISFTLEQVHPHDLGTILDSEGVAVRAGHHCAMPVMDFFGVPATARASFGCYTNREDVDQLIGALHRALEVFG